MHQKKTFNITLAVTIQLRAGNPAPLVLQRATAGVMDMYASGVAYGQAQGFDAQIRDVTLVEVQEDTATAQKAQQPTFKMGDWVGWESQSQGVKKSKNGEVIDVIPAGEHPVKELFPSLHKKSIGKPRDHESYVIKVGTKVYWPVVKLLKAA